MIGYLKGKVLDQQNGNIVLGVGSSDSAVGYSVAVPSRAEYFFDSGRVVELQIHTHVREDLIDLYGFVNLAEKRLFLTLLGVNGIGPKNALGILSRVSPNELIQAILKKDKAFLVKIPGIGKKTAERVVLELADKFDVESELLPVAAEKIVTSTPSVLTDAKVALAGLGFKEGDIDRVLTRLTTANEFNQPQELIKEALKQMGN